VQFFDFVRTIDAKFEKHDLDGAFAFLLNYSNLATHIMNPYLLVLWHISAAWPSAIDDFAEWAKGRVS
jgi:hypothetical protein